MVTPSALIEQIEARLAGEIDDQALAAWALDQFYQEEMDSPDDDDDREAMTM